MFLEKIIIALDDTNELTTKIIDFIYGISCQKAQVIIVNIVKEPPLLSDAMKDQLEDICYPLSVKILEDAVQKLEDRKFENLETLILIGDPTEEILNLAEKEDVSAIIVGSHNKGFLTKFLVGSVSCNIIDHAHCTVVVVR